MVSATMHTFAGKLEEYEFKVNAVRGAQSLVSWVIEIPEQLPHVLEWLHLSDYIKDVDWSSLENLKPLKVVLGSAKDFLTFLEFPIRIKRMYDSWDDVKGPKFASMSFQLVQKGFECFLILNTWKIIDLAKWCAGVGNWTGLHVTVGNITVVKEICVLASSTFAVYVATEEMKKHQVKQQRCETCLNGTAPGSNDSVKDVLSEVKLVKKGKDNNQLGNILQNYLNRADRPANRDAPKLAAIQIEISSIRRHLKTLKGELKAIKKDSHLKWELNKKLDDIEKEETKLKYKENFYIRRYFFESYLKNKFLDLPDNIQNEVKNKIEDIRNQFGDQPQEPRLLKRIINYKIAKTEALQENAKIEERKSAYSRRFDIAKIAIVTFGLMTVACVTFTSLAAFSVAVGVCGWFTLLAVGTLGLARTWNIAFNSVHLRQAPLPFVA